MASRLAGKVALVTGASRGIGRATALTLGKAGATVVVNYVSSKTAADKVVQEIGSERAVALQADVSNVSSGKNLIKEVTDRYGKIDILVLNAALLAQNGSIDGSTEEDFDRLYNANVKGPFFMVKEAKQYIPQGGRILLFSTSITALSTVTPNYLLYASTKGAIEQMARVLAKDLGAKGITVNTISPGPVDTEGFREGKPEQLIKTIASWNPSNRLGAPEDIADVVTFLASEESRWINGQNIRINGGMTVG